MELVSETPCASKKAESMRPSPHAAFVAVEVCFPFSTGVALLCVEHVLLGGGGLTALEEGLDGGSMEVQDPCPPRDDQVASE